MQSELKPCPFCGCADIRINIHRSTVAPHYGATAYSIGCYQCGGSVPSRYDRSLLISFWNTRASDAEITRLTEALREADENINLKADFIDATINQLAAKDQDIYELKEALRAAEEREKGLREFVEMFVKLARLGTGDKPVARSGRVNVSSDMLYIAKSLVGPLHDA